MRNILWIVVEEKGCTLVTLPLSLPPNIGHFVHHRTAAAAATDAALNRKIIKATWPRALSFECFPAKSLQKMLFPPSVPPSSTGANVGKTLSLSLSLSRWFKYCFYGFRFLNDLTGCCCCCWIELANKVCVCVCVDWKKERRKNNNWAFETWVEQHRGMTLTRQKKSGEKYKRPTETGAEGWASWANDDDDSVATFWFRNRAAMTN